MTGEATDAEKVCPRCGTRYADDFEFCPKDASPLIRADDDGLDPLVGTVLDDRYRISGRVGRGGSGTVYRAVQLRVGREVAVKLLAAEAASDAERLARFEQEAQALSRLRHPGTLKLIDFGWTPERRPFLVSPLLQGRSLGQLIDDEGPLAAPRVLALMEQICDALVEAHEAGFIHRDLKPENLFVQTISGRESAVVLDFGVAHMRERDTRLTREGTSMGTAPYMSPEQVRGDELDARSDLYSLGIVAYECLAGRAPFLGGNYISIAMQHLERDPPPLRNFDQLDVPPPVERLVMSCLEKLPDDRPPTAQALRDEIRDLAVSLKASIDPPAPMDVPVAVHQPAAAEPARATRWMLIGAVVLVVAGLVWTLTRPSGHSGQTGHSGQVGHSGQAAPHEVPSIAPATTAPATAAPKTVAPSTAAPATAAPTTQRPQAPATAPEAAPRSQAAPVPQSAAPRSRAPATRKAAPTTGLPPPPDGLY